MKVVTFGEIMLRLSTPGFTRFVQSQQFDVTYGGGEANVAVALSNFGLESHFVSKIPEHEIGQSAVNHLRRYGVHTGGILRGGDRLGIYFLETGASQRSSKVVYDRADSAVSQMEAGEVDWTAIMDGARWFHWTGITAALGERAQQCLVAACTAARSAGATISCDLNFRKKLWTPDEARAVMVPMMEHVDVCISNEEDADKCLGLTAGSTDVDAGSLEEDGYVELCQTLRTKFGFSVVAITLRESHSASDNGWSAMIHDADVCSEPYRSRRYDIRLVDRVGGGDSFASGLIFGLLSRPDSREAIEFAVAASALKQTIPGDFNLVSEKEVDSLVKGSGSGRVER